MMTAYAERAGGGASREAGAAYAERAGGGAVRGDLVAGALGDAPRSRSTARRRGAG